MRCVLQVPCSEADCTKVNAQMHLDDAAAAATYASRFNMQMLQGMGNVIDIADQGESVPTLKVAAPVLCTVLSSSSPELMSRGGVCTLAPYKDLEVNKYVFIGGEDFCEVPQAYFHYASWASKGEEFVSDIQGVEDEVGNFTIIDPVVLRTEKTKVQQYITTYMASQQGRELPPAPTGPHVGPTNDRFEMLHPKCGPLCSSFDPMRKGAKGKKNVCGVNVTC
jgi:hypothetical protein